MKKELSRRETRKRFLQFCRKHNISPMDLLSYCEGRLGNFPYWYVDYLNYTRNEIKNRIRTGVVKQIKYEDVWSG
mgnify:CR=1 FL=1